VSHVTGIPLVTATALKGIERRLKRSAQREEFKMGTQRTWVVAKICCRLVPRTALVASVAAMLMSSVAYAAAVSCTPPTTVTAIPPPVGPSLNLISAHGGLASVGPAFLGGPGNCPGFTATAATLTYTPSTADNGKTISFGWTIEESITGPAQPIEHMSHLDGTETFSGGFSGLLDITMRTFTVQTDEDLTLLHINMGGGLLASGVTFNQDLLTGPFAEAPGGPDFLVQQLAVTLLQGTVNPLTDSFVLSLPGSAGSAVVPVPEPPSLLILLTALAGLGALLGKRRLPRRIASRTL
jgi:hypothetical protein